MKNLLSLGTVLGKEQQKRLMGGYPGGGEGKCGNGGCKIDDDCNRNGASNCSCTGKAESGYGQCGNAPDA